MVVFDTNIVISIFNGHSESIQLFEKIRTESQIGLSIISLVEIYSGAQSRDLKKIRSAISDLTILPFDQPEIAEMAASYRRDFHITTPDAIILATCAMGPHHFYTYDKELKKIKKSWVHILSFS